MSASTRSSRSGSMTAGAVEMPRPKGDMGRNLTALRGARLMSPARTAVRKAAKPAPKKAASNKAVAKKTKAPSLGALPEWNLADLYPAMDAPELKRDLERAD